MVVDPDNITQNHVMNWFSIILISGFAYWFITLGWQYWIVYRNYQARRKKVGTHDEGELIIPPLQETLANDEEIRKTFQEFAELHLLQESVRFLEDVTLFQLYFFDKNEGWQRQKAKHLYETYIKSSSPMEINVSALARSKCAATLGKMFDANHGGNNNMDAHELVDVFNECQKQIVDMLTAGMWREFFLRRRRRKTAGVGVVSVAGGGGNTSSRMVGGDV
jgi:hypothetical protein